jgi:hypothetical protein
LITWGSTFEKHFKQHSLNKATNDTKIKIIKNIATSEFSPGLDASREDWSVMVGCGLGMCGGCQIGRELVLIL